MSAQVSLFKLTIVIFTAVSLVVFGDTAGKLLTERGVAPGIGGMVAFCLGCCAYALCENPKI